MTSVAKKVAFSNKIHPYFSGFSSDLMFWAAINTLFLTTVKHLTASNINLMISIGMLVSILSNFFVLKIIKKIGNIHSIRLGVFLLLIACLLITFSNSFFWILIGEIIYEVSYLFKNMDNIILRENLVYEKKEDQYIKYQNKGLMIYSFITMIISFFSGIIFNINAYLPMFIAITFCVLNIILSYLLYEYKGNDCKKEEKVIPKKSDTKLPKIVCLLLLLFGIAYSLIELSQRNGKILIQYSLSDFLSDHKVAIYLSAIITISRVARVLSDYIFLKIYHKLNHKLLIVIESLLFFSIFSMIIGSFLPSLVVKVIVMAVGFSFLLVMRDSLECYIKAEILNNCVGEKQQDALSYMILARKIGNFAFSGVASLLLLRLNIVWVMTFLLVVAIFNIIVIKKVYHYLTGKEPNTN